MKFIVVFACLIAAASAVPTLLVAPAAVTYQSQQQSLVPIGTQVHTTVSHGPAIVKASPLIAAPVAPLGLGYGLGAPLGLASPYGLGAPLGLASPLGLGYSKTIVAPGLLGGPLLH